MVKYGSWLRFGVAALSYFVCLSSTLADTPENEFKALIQINQEVKPLGENPFGESISLYDGGLSFRQVDIELRGNGPTISVSRSRGDFDSAMVVSSGGVPLNEQSFADWQLEIPHIESLSADINGSQQGTSPHYFFRDDASRCSNFQQAPTISILSPTGTTAPEVYAPSAWWHGYKLRIPGISDQDLLVRDSSNNPLKPQMAQPGGGTYSFPIVTTDNWQVSCLAQTSNGALGEGFLVVGPDGTKYWMDWLAVMPASTGGVSASGYPQMTRYMVEMLASKIQDRFGNTLTYTYNSNGQPTNIRANDGRQVNFTYNAQGFVGAIGVQGAPGSARTWSYSYQQTSVGYALSGVTLPDNSSWSFNLVGFNQDTDFGKLIVAPPTGCYFTLNPGAYPVETGTITHPSGLVGKFTVVPAIRGRSYVPYTCSTLYSGNGTYHLVIPNIYGMDTIVSKQYTGAGLPVENWEYSFSSPSPSFSQDCSSGCVSTNWTDVVDPNNNRIRYTFSDKFDNSEGKLLETDYFSGSSSTSPIKTIVAGYASASSGPWPTHYGSSQEINVNSAQIESYAPQNLQTIREEGDAYTWQALGFNSYGQASDVKRYNTITTQSAIEESISYLNDPSLWVLALPQATTNVATGEVESSNTYSSSDTLLSRSKFGETLMSYTFNSTGQLASFTDGNYHTTWLNNYLLGIPGEISYPDGTSETIGVDSYGDITSITDQAGYTTQYNYDPIGRLTQITYPANDPNGVSWYAKKFAYLPTSATERGITGLHWDRTTTVGNAVTTTYFDAMLRPLVSDTSISGTANSDITSVMGYDYTGATTFTSFPVSGTPAITDVTAGTRNTYDALQRLTLTQEDSELGTLTTIRTYLGGAQITVKDPNGNTTATNYQVFDEPAYNDPILVNAPGGITQTIVRDIYGNPKSITQSGAYVTTSGTENDSVTKTLTYDQFYRLCAVSEPESGSSLMGYDSENNLVWSLQGQPVGGACLTAAPSNATVRTYDSMNRLLTITPPAGTQNSVYTYDVLGNVSTVQSGLTAWSAVRNSRGQVTQESLQVTGQNPWTIGYQFDGYDNVNAITYPNGEAVGYTPDALGRATMVGGYVSGVGYFPNGQIAGFNFGNGAGYVTEENGRLLVSNFSYGLGSTLDLSEDFTYDGNSNITNVADQTSNGPRSKLFGYDALNRLTSAKASGLYGTENYTYDALDNLRTRSTGSTSLTLNYDTNNRLVSVAQNGAVTTQYGYDAQGNRNSLSGGGATTQYSFDVENQLLQIPGVESYAYDGAGRRVSKATNAGASTYYFYNQAGQLMYQWDTAAGNSTNFIFLGKKLVAKDAVAGEANAGSTAVSVMFPPSNSVTGSYTVSWYGVVGATSYQLQLLESGVWTTIYTGSADAYDISGEPNGVYEYRVAACSNGTCGAWSATSEVTVNLESTLAIPLLAPTLSINRTTSPGTYSVSWTGVFNATTYNLQEQVQSGAWTTVYSGSSPSWSATNKPTGYYGYQVQACNSAGCGPWSSVVSIGANFDISPIINLILDDS